MSTPRPVADTVWADPVRGHISLGVAGAAAQVTFADLGPVLNLWAGQGAELTPQVANELAAALWQWSRKKRSQAGAA